MRTPSDRSDPGFRAAGLALALLLLALHLLGALNAAGNADFWRDVYWASEIAHARQFPLGGPPIYGLMQLGPWWYYLLALPLAATGQVVSIAVLMQLLAGSKYLLAWILGLRTFGARFALLFTGALAFAGWSTFPLIYGTHTALVEAAILLLALHGLGCWSGLSWRRAAVLGLLAGLCVHAHPSTAILVVVLGTALLVRRPSFATVAKLASAALVAALLLLPPLLQGDGSAEPSRALGRYLGEDVGVAWWLRVPKLLHGVVTGGAWHGLLLETQWRIEVVRLVDDLFLASLAVAAIGIVLLLRRASPERVALRGALALMLVQASFLALVRPITPLWMGVQLLPTLALALALGWNAALERGAAGRTAAWLAFASFVAISLVPFGHALRQPESVRGPLDANPYMDMASRSERYVTVPIAFLDIRTLQRASSTLCAGGTLHGTLAYVVEHSFATTVEAACGSRPELHFGGAAAGAHVAGYPSAVWSALGLRPANQVSGFGLGTSVRAIAPEVGGAPTRLAPTQINPETSARAPGAIERSFRGPADAVLAIQNRFRFAAPLEVDEVTAAGAPARLVHRGADAWFYRCAACAGTGEVEWHVAARGIEPHTDVYLLSP